MQDRQSQSSRSSSDPRERATAAAPAAMSAMMTPRDETEAEEDPFAEAGSGSGTEEGEDRDEEGQPRINIHTLSSDDDVVTGEESEAENSAANMSTDQAAGDGPPISASTPVRTEKPAFRIVDIENRGNFLLPDSGDAHSADGNSDGNPAVNSDGNTAANIFIAAHTD